MPPPEPPGTASNGYGNVETFQGIVGRTIRIPSRSQYAHDGLPSTTDGVCNGAPICGLEVTLTTGYKGDADFQPARGQSKRSLVHPDGAPCTSTGHPRAASRGRHVVKDCVPGRRTPRPGRYDTVARLVTRSARAADWAAPTRCNRRAGAAQFHSGGSSYWQSHGSRLCRCGGLG